MLEAAAVVAISRQLRQDLAAASLRQHLKKAAAETATSLMEMELPDLQILVAVVALVELAQLAMARQVQAVLVS